jgi:hypothetical protein
MSRSRFVRPASRVLPLTGNDTIVVKDNLNAGEYRRMLASMARDDGSAKTDPLKYPVALITAYLLDWSLVDDDGRPFVIRDQPADVVAAAVDAIDHESQVEIRIAIETHIAAMDARRAEEKKSLAGASTSPPISTSPFVAAGVTNG